MVNVVNKNTHVEVELRVFMVAFQQNQGNIQHVNPVASVMARSINFLTVFPHKIRHFSALLRSLLPRVIVLQTKKSPGGRV